MFSSVGVGVEGVVVRTVVVAGVSVAVDSGTVKERGGSEVLPVRTPVVVGVVPGLAVGGTEVQHYELCGQMYGDGMVS